MEMHEIAACTHYLHIMLNLTLLPSWNLPTEFERVWSYHMNVFEKYEIEFVILIVISLEFSFDHFLVVNDLFKNGGV